MMLQALYELYQRKVHDGSGDLAEAGWEWKEIPFILIISREGRLVDIEDTRGEKKRAQPFRVPQGVKKTSGVAANLLWDAPAYILGYKPDMKLERLQETRAAFRQKITNLFSETPEDSGIAAVLHFLDSDSLAQAQAHEKWPDIAEAMPFMTFRLDGDLEHKTVCERKAVEQALSSQEVETSDSGQCLITGETHALARLHPAIKGVMGAQTAGANIVSFNLEAFTSYGKQQGANAPVSTAAADAYTKALNWLLSKDSSQKLQLGDTTVVFWAEKQEEFEDWFGHIYGDDPVKNTDAMKAFYKAAGKGIPPQCDVDTRFYVLGLCPNAARISIRFWHAAPIREIAGNIQRYFDDFALTSFIEEGVWPRHKQLLAACASDHKLDRLPPTLSAQLFESINFGKPYPMKLLHLALTRARAEAEVSDQRAAIIKGCLIRNFKKEITMSLDESCKDVGYLFGCLFAVYDKLKEEESTPLGENKPRTNRRYKYFSSFSARPLVLFPRLAELAEHDLKKLHRSRPGRAIKLEKLIQAIQSKLSPTLLEKKGDLSMQEQALFVLGFYHQREKLFEKSEKSSEQKEAA